MKRNILFDWESFVREAITRRKEQKFTQEQFAVLSGVSKPTLSAFKKERQTSSSIVP